ncbi:hypothetical protein F5B22DRAFT_627987 [Xylaria bambusicola]|uniref:uncharacterized protein n=1 Tax=Xylaria bambusicola TaxID=326684 RepID=UPI002008A1A6|nr:uncharacterized protein F5B22DRAFT_627987 [Xylaria bambusicola]KAI0505375.1 hypothetical protein F5B22DRAFT_627987 [Xylaria bambusicola]
MSRLPIKVQVGIRDSWDNQDAPVQKAIRNLKVVVGVRVSVDPEWPLLVSDLGSFYPDKTILVVSVAAAVEACCTALTTLADNEANEQWADKFLERADGHVRVFLETSKSREINIVWSDRQKGLVVSFPKGAIPSPSYMLSFFTGCLRKVFEENAKAGTSPSIEPTAADDWADMTVDNKTGTAAVLESLQPPASTQHQSPAIEVVPEVDIIPRPEELLLKPPYHLTVRDLNSSCIEVQCSHSPTLQFLSDYLKKWARTNYNLTNRPPLAEIKLHQSAFGLGIVYDRLTVTVESRHTTQQISPTLLLAMVEGVLGYKSMSSEGRFWTFRKDIEFKSSRY